MGRIITEKVKGMNWRSKISLILIFTIMFSTFVYQGLFKPKPAQAATVTYYVARDTTTNLTADGTCNVTGLTPYTSTGIGKTTTRTTELAAGSRYYPTVTAGATATVLNVYTPVYAAAVDISAISASAALRGLAATNTVKLDLYDYDPAGAANNGVLVASSVARTLTGGTTTTQYTWTAGNFTINGTGRVAAGHRLQFRFTWYSATAGNPRIYFGLAGALTSTNFTVTETAVSADSTPPTVGTVNINPTSTTFTTSAPTITATLTDAQSSVTSCEYTTNGSTWVAGVLSGSASPWTCTGSPTGLSGSLTINVRGTSTGGTGTGTAVARTVDITAPSTNASAAGYTFGNWTATSPVTVSLTPSDGTGSGVAATQYCVDTTNTCTPATSGTSVDVTCAAGTNCTQYVRYRSTDNIGNVETTGSSQVRQDLLAPSTPTLSSPADEAIDQPLNVSLSSAASTDTGSGGVLYYFDVVDTGSYAVNSGWIGATSFAPAGIQNGTTYTWKVKAKDAVGNETIYSTPRSFTTVSQCFRNNPALDFTTSTISTVTSNGGTANYTLRVTNNDIGGCTSTIFTLSTLEYSDEGDNFVDTPTLTSYSLNLAPGASTTVTLGVTARVGKTTGRTKTRVTSAADGVHQAVNSTLTTTNLNVAICTPGTPVLVVGPDAGNVAIGGSTVYSVSIKNTDAGAACTAKTFALTVETEEPPMPNTDFNASSLAYQAQSGTTVNVLLNPGQQVSVPLTVSAKATASTGADNTTTLGLTEAGHTSPADVTVFTVVGNRMLHNSINTSSLKWGGSGGWGVPNGKYGEFICNTCHTLDGTTNNIKKVLNSITTPDTAKGSLPGDGTTIVFTKTSGNPGDSGVLGDDSNAPRATSNKICEVCHTYDAGLNGVKVHAYNQQAYTVDTDGMTPTSNNHRNFNAKDCIQCHQHNNGFMPAQCTACHGNPPNGPLELAVSPFTTGSTTEGKHNTHVNTLAYTCYNCHSNYVMPNESGVNPGFGDISISFSNFSAVSGGPSTSGTYTGQSNVSYNNVLGSGTKTCSSVYCHGGGTQTKAALTSSGTKGNAVWDGAVVCGDCHGAKGGASVTWPTTGSHVGHASTTGLNLACSDCHGGTAGSSGHVDGRVAWEMNTTIAGANAKYNGTLSGLTAGFAPSATYYSCGTTVCHGTTSPVWGANTTNATCVKCHGVAGTNQATYDATKPLLSAPGYNGTGLDTGGSSSSADAQVGTHDAHLRGLLNYSNPIACTECHASVNPDSAAFAGHMDGAGTLSWGALATTGPSAPNYSSISGTCSTTYCHGNMQTGGSDKAPEWNQTGYLTGVVSAAADCGKCHGAPPATATHIKTQPSTYYVLTECNGCHSHFRADATGFSDKTKHINGAMDGGLCDSCHGYQEASWSGAIQRAAEGKGAHAKHVAHLVAKWGGTLNPSGDSFGSGPSWTNVCGVCHNNATHTMTEAIGGNGRQISIPTTYQFGPNPPLYSGIPATSSSVNPKSCSNIDCHYSTSPVWSSY